MIKILSVIALIAVCAYFALQGVWMMQVTAFGYEVSFSALVLIAAFIILLYLLDLFSKPFEWMRNYRMGKSLKNAKKETTFWQLVLTTVLDRNDTQQAIVLKQCKTICKKNALDGLLIEALFNPNTAVFEKLMDTPQTRLAGLRGLILEAEKAGDWTAQGKLLTQAVAEYPTVSWLLRHLLVVQLMQDNPAEALETLEKLSDKKWIQKDRYTIQKAEILFRLKRYKEAFSLTPDNPMIALAYAKSEPKKAADILKKAWSLTPDWDVYEAYRTAIAVLPAQKRVKEMNAFLQSNAAGGLYLVAMANEAVQESEWAIAKENLETYLNGYPLTRQVALMMAKIEGDGYHHAERAREWIQKSESL